MRWMLAAGLCALAAPAAAQKGTAPGELEAIIAAGVIEDGLPTFVAASVEQEYAVLAALGLSSLRQTLVFAPDGTPYDVHDTEAGPVRFDISSFFGEGF